MQETITRNQAANRESQMNTIAAAEMNARCYAAIAREFGADHASAVFCWYGDDCAADQADAAVAAVVENYRNQQ